MTTIIYPTSKIGRLIRATAGFSVSARIGFYTGPRSASGCRDWLGATDRKGYAVLSGPEGRSCFVSRLILGLGFGDARVAMHACDNPTCVEPTHLRAGTQGENVADMASKGRMATGARAGRAVLTEAQVASIRARLSMGERQAPIAREMGVSKSTINVIALGKTWRRR